MPSHLSQNWTWLIVNFKKNSLKKTAKLLSFLCRCHHLGYSSPLALYCIIWCRASSATYFRPEQSLNPTSLKPALPMALTTDNNAKDEWTQPKPNDILKRFHAIYIYKRRYFKKKVSKFYCMYNPFMPCVKAGFSTGRGQKWWCPSFVIIIFDFKINY